MFTQLYFNLLYKIYNNFFHQLESLFIVKYVTDPKAITTLTIFYLAHLLSKYLASGLSASNLSSSNFLNK